MGVSESVVQLSCLLLVIIIWSVFKRMRGVNVDCGFEAVIERQLNYSKVVLRMCVCVYGWGCVHVHVRDACMHCVCVRACMHACT